MLREAIQNLAEKTGEEGEIITPADRKVFELRGELESVIFRYKARVDELERRVKELEGEKGVSAFDLIHF